jgi:putative ABC transport system ATP-binding protein
MVHWLLVRASVNAMDDCLVRSDALAEARSETRTETQLALASAIRCIDIVRSFGEGAGTRRVLDGLSLDVKEGELLAIVGASGSGKSSLLSVLGGLDRDYRGSVALFGQRLEGLPDDRLSKLRGRSLGFVFQSFQLLPHLTALENVLLPSLFGPKVRDDVERARAALDRVGLLERARDRPGSLSGGQRQRVAIARAILLRPRLLLADEPTGNLDDETGAQIVGLFQRLHGAGDVTIIVATHDARIATSATRTLRLVAGRLEEA